MILADINEDVQVHPILTIFNQMGLAKVTTATHGTSRPNTHNRGQNPIDGIFISSNLLQGIKTGCFAFGEGIPSDHGAMWIDLSIMSLGWTALPAMASLTA